MRRVEKVTAILKCDIGYGTAFPQLRFYESLLLLLPCNVKKTTAKITLISPQEITNNLNYMTEGKSPALYWLS